MNAASIKINNNTGSKLMPLNPHQMQSEASQ